MTPSVQAMAVNEWPAPTHFTRRPRGGGLLDDADELRLAASAAGRRPARTPGCRPSSSTLVRSFIVMARTLVPRLGRPRPAKWCRRMVKFRRGGGLSEQPRGPPRPRRPVAVGGGAVGIIGADRRPCSSRRRGRRRLRHRRRLQPDPGRRRRAPWTPPTSRWWRRCPRPSTTSRRSGRSDRTGSGPRYRPATLVLFTDAVSTDGCGSASVVGRALLLPGRRAGVPRPVVLPGAGQPLRRARRLRPRVRARPRARPPRPEPRWATASAVHQRQQQEPEPGQRAVRAPRAPGRLLRRDLGPLGPGPRPHRAGRPRRGPGARPRPSATTASRSRPASRCSPTSWTHGSSEAAPALVPRRASTRASSAACDTFVGCRPTSSASSGPSGPR